MWAKRVDTGISLMAWFLVGACKSPSSKYSSVLMSLIIIVDWATCIHFNWYPDDIYHCWQLEGIEIVKVEAWFICKKQCTQLFINMSTGNISLNLTSWRSGMSTGLLMTWWLKCWNPLVLLFGLARTMMVMSSQIFWLKVSFMMHKVYREAGYKAASLKLLLCSKK